ncbi:MAG TPA: hypothetical protein EYM84_00040 [Flavobacteriales bacterium]|nr:hypothetical protein [Flavobacteriales bacterium]HIN38643.1 hypothetical protein [Flavobacteriales bacterium]HIO67301.1 hypothetical protein [Flavobacteriales bacterium]
MWLRANIYLKYKERFIHLLVVVTIIGLLFSCKAEIDPPTLSAGDADFSSLVAIGGDFLAGYENGALSREGQQNSIPQLLSLQFNEVYSQLGELSKVSSFKQPLMPLGQGFGFNSKKWEGEFISPVTLGYKVDCEGVESLSPLKNILNLSVQSAGLQYLIDGGYQNLAVPSAGMEDITDPNFGLHYSQGNSNPFYGKFASDPGTSTILQDALNLSPTFSLIWVGMEDIYSYASVGGYNKTIPSASAFSADLDAALAPLTSTGGKGAIANIPELTSFPFYTLVAWNRAELDQNKADSLNKIYQGGGVSHINFAVGNNGFVIDDSTQPFDIRQMVAGEYVTLTVPLDSMRCFLYGLFVNVVHDRYALDTDEVQIINTAISDYNVVIKQKAAEYNLAHVDMNSFFKTVEAGVKWNGVAYDAEFVSGGFYSLDGYHPNQQGYGMLANEFIKAINNQYSATVPTTNCMTCVGIRFP